MAQSRDGGCTCGGVRYRFGGDPVVLTVCHCTECQRQSGSAFGMSLIVRAEDFQLLKGTLKFYERSSESGNKVRCAFCPDCGTRIYHALERTEGATLNIKPGTFDDTSWLTPGAHAWTSSKQHWFAIPENVPAFDKQPNG